MKNKVAVSLARVHTHTHTHFMFTKQWKAFKKS